MITNNYINKRLDMYDNVLENIKRSTIDFLSEKKYEIATRGDTIQNVLDEIVGYLQALVDIDILTRDEAEEIAKERYHMIQPYIRYKMYIEIKKTE